MTDRISEMRIVATGVALVDGDEVLVVGAKGGASLTLRWTRDDDNVLTGGTVDALTADLPKARPDIDVVHAFAIGTQGDGRRTEARFYIEWIHRRSKRVTYTILSTA